MKAKVERFAEIVHRYCVWVESPSVDANADMQTAQKLLAELQFFVLDLPDDEFEDEDVELEDVTAEQWHDVRNRFASLPVEGYWTVFDPTHAQENDPFFALLSDDLADIYRDIKYGLLLFDAGHISEACREWKSNFKIHWGRHLLDAQKVVYSWLNKNGGF